jgi:hypothetical protein
LRAQRKRSEQRYSEKPDGGAGSGAGTPKRKTTVNGQRTLGKSSKIL